MSKLGLTLPLEREKVTSRDTLRRTLVALEIIRELPFE
jgi:hypothetical protein